MACVAVRVRGVFEAYTGRASALRLCCVHGGASRRERQNACAHRSISVLLNAAARGPVVGYAILGHLERHANRLRRAVDREFPVMFAGPDRRLAPRALEDDCSLARRHGPTIRQGKGTQQHIQRPVCRHGCGNVH